MRNKYFILAVTFLCTFVGQRSYGQDYDGGTDYSTIDNLVEGLLRLNPDIEVIEISETQGYVDIINNDNNPDNDFLDTNDDGFVDANDNLYQQNLANTLGLPRTTSVADLEAALLAALSETVQLYEVIVENNYKNLQNGTSGFTIWPEIGPTIDSDGNPIYYAGVHYNSLADYLMANSSGGSGNTSPQPPTKFQIAQNIASTAITTGLAFNEVYTTMSDAIFSNTPMTVSTNTLIKNIFDSNALSVETFKNDIKLVSKFDGIAVLNVAGKVLGIASAYNSIDTLVEDINDGGGVSMVNVADVAISVGSLFIKSNVVGLAVSGSWMLIKGDFGE